MRIVIALGGNVLLRRGENPDADIQHRHVLRAARSIAPLAVDHQLIICHGNGPQIGLLAHESGTDRALSVPYPLDALGAQTQGMIGYWLVQELANAGVRKPVVALVTQPDVDPDDPAFAEPTKFIGAGYAREQAEAAATRYGWTMVADGNRWRQVVALPEPLRVNRTGDDPYSDRPRRGGRVGRRGRAASDGGPHRPDHRVGRRGGQGHDRRAARPRTRCGPPAHPDDHAGRAGSATRLWSTSL